MRLAVANDTHFLHCDDITKAVRKFVRCLDELGADALLFTGDISDARDWPKRLSHIRQSWKQDIYFVLGNHDYYHWSWGAAFDAARDLMAADDQITWLDTDCLMLDGKTGMVGSSSPACLTTGISPLRSGVWEDISDFHVIEDLELRQGCPPEMCALQTTLAVKCAGKLLSQLKWLMQNADVERVVVALHVAPFAFSAKWRGEPTEENMKPFYISKYLGMAVEEVAGANPDIEFVCLHGHTHGAFRGRHPNLKNIMVMAGEAEYKLPRVQMVLDTELSFCGAHTA